MTRIPSHHDDDNNDHELDVLYVGFYLQLYQMRKGGPKITSLRFIAVVKREIKLESKANNTKINKISCFSFFKFLRLIGIVFFSAYMDFVFYHYVPILLSDFFPVMIFFYSYIFSCCTCS